VGRAVQAGRVSVEALAGEFGVSVMTVRRDLAELARLGKVNRVHGGAIPSRAGMAEFSFREKATDMAEEKRAIARAVSVMIEPGMSVSLDTGTTTLEVARMLVGRARLRVLTTSLAIASVLHADQGIDLVLLGGTVRKNTPDLWGGITEENIRRFRSDLAVLGTDAISPSGAFTTDVPTSRVSRALMETAGRKVLVADHSKFSKTAFVRHAALSEMDLLVTDERCPQDVRAWLGEAAREVVYAPLEAEDE
jgi:DeoR/GlpR family transcriptional regulator of sugar metabolism